MIRYRSGAKQDSGIPVIRTEYAGTVSLNKADSEELTVLPGIGETLSVMIISERFENGDFFYPEDLEAVKGIGPKTLDIIRTMINLEQKESED